MIRFVDLGKQLGVLEPDDPENDWPRQFCFFDTIFSQFVKVEGSVVFDSYADFAACCALDDDMTPERIERLVRLMPDWARKER